MRVLAWCGVVAPLLRLGLILVLGGLHPTYSQSRDFISELGAPDAPYAPVMNYLGITVVGALLLLFSVSLYRSQPSGGLSLLGSLSLAVSGVAFIAVGLLPCDRPGCSAEAPSLTMQRHLVAGLAGMTTQTLAAMVFGLRLVTGTGARWYAIGSLVFGLVALIALALLVGSSLRLPMPGLAQKTMQISADLWVLMSALYALRSSRSAV